MSTEKERLLARKARLEERLAALEKAEAAKRGKEDKRRAELAGRAVLKHARKDEAFARQLRAILDREITGVRLRALFDLPPKAGRGNGQDAAPENRHEPPPAADAPPPS